MRSTARLLAALVLVSATSARADVVEASVTTLATIGQQTRGGAANTAPDLVDVATAYEIVSVSAREVRNPVFENLEFVLSGWGSLDAGDLRWNAGTTSDKTGDLTTGYVRGQLFKRALTLRAGRAFVAAGVGQMLQLDGADVLVRLPFGVSVSAYGGIPVSQRFGTRSGTRSWNPTGGDLAYGGRLGLNLPFAGAFGRGLDVGASVVVVEDGKNTLDTLVRQDAGLDLRVQPTAGLVIAANGTWGLDAEQLAGATAEVLWTVNSKLFANLDVKYVTPGLLLSRNSILSVFASGNRTDLGGGVRYQLTHALGVGFDYHALLEPGEPGKTELGHEAAAKAEWEHGATTAGAELSYLTAAENGWIGARVFGRRELGKAFLACDVTGHLFENAVNAQDSAVSGTLSAGYRFTPDWSAVVAGRAGMTPFLEQQADAMVKIVYNPTYRVKEVK